MITSLLSPTTKKEARKLPPAQMEQFVRVASAQGGLAQDLKNELLGELMRTRQRLEQITCSSTWLSQCWQSGEVFPPTAETTPMVACQCERCRRIGRLWPAHYRPPVRRRSQTRQGFLSYECYLEALTDEEAAFLPSSPSGLALRAIREGRIKLRRQRTHLAGRRYTT